MKRTITTAAGIAIVSLGLAGISFLPAGAVESTDSATTEEDTSFLADRLGRLKEALAGLVDDGTLTQDEADKIAETLNGSDALGPHGPGHHGGPGGMSLDAAAAALGMSADELRTALQDGSSLADVAEAQGVDTAALVDALVQAASDHLDEEVSEGDLTQEQADEMRADLEERITAEVEDGSFIGGPGGLHHPRGFGGADESTDGGTTEDPTEGTTDGTTDGTTAEGAAFSAATTRV
jgi:polyhydroxyalkanoate synthesis regulator phasin